MSIAEFQYIQYIQMIHRTKLSALVALCWFSWSPGHAVFQRLGLPPWSFLTRLPTKFWTNSWILDEIVNSRYISIVHTGHMIYIYRFITSRFTIQFLYDWLDHDVSYRLVWCTVEVTNATSLPRRWCPMMRRRTASFIYLAIHEESDVQ